MAPIAIGMLLVATVGAFIWSQRLKREPLVIDRVEFISQDLRNAEDPYKPTVFSPNGDCRRDRMSINFRTTKSDYATVEIIGPGGKPIRTLVEDRFFKRYREHTLWWDGRKDNGRVPQTGGYRVRVTMRDLDRVLYLPVKIRLRNYERTSSACATKAARIAAAGNTAATGPGGQS
ncbi:MAG: hypothetical protein M3Y23_01315 [Actinomycetota bacterium]|nr:hypothetical protein [Actinomycetota bacterium]